MSLSRTWIDTHLSAKERQQFVDVLLERSAAPTAQMILDMLQEHFPHLEDFPSLNSCNEWRRKSLIHEIQRREIRAESKAARELAGDGGVNFGEANRVLTEQILFEQLQALRHARDGADAEKSGIDAGALHNWILSASRLAQSSRRERELEAKLREADARETERKEQALKISTDETKSEAEKAAEMRALFGMG